MSPSENLSALGDMFILLNVFYFGAPLIASWVRICITGNFDIELLLVESNRSWDFIFKDVIWSFRMEVVIVKEFVLSSTFIIDYSTEEFCGMFIL